MTGPDGRLRGRHREAPGEAADAQELIDVDGGSIVATGPPTMTTLRTGASSRVLALGTGDEPEVVEARAFEAEMCRARAGEVRPFVSKSCYRSTARLLDAGDASWTSID